MGDGNNNNLKQLIEQAGQGNQEAFHALYESLADRLFSYARSRVNSREDATDIVQDIFIDVWNALPRFEYRSSGHFYAFVFTITKRRLSRHYRSARHDQSLDELPMSAHPRTESDIADPDGMGPLVKQLPDKYRDVVTLRYWSGLSFKEIADALGTTETNAKVRHHRALGRLRDLMH